MFVAELNVRYHKIAYHMLSGFQSYPNFPLTLVGILDWNSIMVASVGEVASSRAPLTSRKIIASW